VRAHILTLSLLLTVGLFLLCLGALSAAGDAPRKPEFWRPMIAGAAVVLFTLRAFWRLFKWRTVFRDTQYVSLNGGAMHFRQFSPPYELWIFCDTPFGRYEGDVTIVCNGLRHIIRLPFEGVRAFYRGKRKDYSPIVWRSPKDLKSDPDDSYVEFHLTSSYSNSVMFPAPETEGIELMVKKKRERENQKRGQQKRGQVQKIELGTCDRRGNR
jgi:hypothetical protein